MLIQIILASLAVMAAALVGVISVWKGFGSIIERNLNYLVSFAAGVFLVLVYILSKEVILHGPSPAQGFFWIVAGLLVVYLAVKLIPESHHHHHKDETLDARKLLIGDSLHNIGDGILIAAAFLTSSTLGIAATISIFFHELVQEISEFFVLKKGGYSTKGALKVNFMTASTILVGSVGGYFLLDQFAMFEFPVLGLATGALLALLLEDLIPHSLEHAKEKNCTHKHILAVAIGAIAMFTIFSFTSDSHVHGGDGHEDHNHAYLEQSLFLS